MIRQQPHDLSRVFVFKVLTVHRGMRASIPRVHAGFKIRR